MLSMLRSNLYRLIKTRFTWAFFICYLLVVCLSALVYVLIASNAAGASENLAIPSMDITAAQMYGRALATGAGVPLCAGIFLASYLSADFKTNSIKNVLQAKGGRTSYVLAAAATIPVVCIAFVAAGSAAAEVVYRVLGYSISGYGFGSLAPLFCEVILVSAAYSSIIALVVFASGSETLGVVAAILVPSGLLESLLRVFLANTFSGIPLLRDCLDGYLGAQMAMLDRGAVSDAGGFIAAAATFAIAIAVGVFVMKRRELA